MPRAPKLERSVTATPLPGARRQGAETFASSGGLVAQAQENFGNQTFQVGLRAYSQVRTAELEAASNLEKLTIRKRFNDLDHLLLQDNERGLLNKTGREPMDLQDQYVEEWDTTANDMIAGDLKTDGGRQFYEEEKTRRRDAFLGRTASHSQQQMRVYRGQELAATIQSAVQQGALAADPRDPRAGEAVAFQVQVIEDSIDTNAQRLGLGPEQAKAMKDAARSQLHIGAIENLIAKGKPRDAKDYFDGVDDQISAPQRANLLEKLNRNTNDAIAFAAANQIWAEHGPSQDDDRAAIEIDKLENLARTAAKGDGEVYQLIRGYLRDRKQGVDAGRRERQNTRDNAIWGSVMQGATASTIRNLPEFKLAPAADQQKIVDYLERQALQLENLAASRDSRAYAAAQRRERELEDKGYSTYLDLKSDPARLKTLAPAEIRRMLPDVGAANVNRILNEQEQLLKSEAAAKTATIDNDLFNDVAYNAGMDYAYDTPAQLKEEQRARKGRLRATVEDEIQRLSALKPGGQLSLEEKRTVMTAIVDRKVMLDVFGPDREAIAATVQDDERGIAYVPLDKVPDTKRQQFANYLRGVPRQGGMTFEVRPPSTTEIIQANRAKIEKAYALYLLGRPDKEITNALEGKE